MSRIPASTRRGAALVLTLIVLAALILLGVPFLMSQSVSLSGSETFRARLAAGNGRDSAESLGVGLAAHAMYARFAQPALGDPVLRRNGLDADIDAEVGGPVSLRTALRPDRIHIRLDQATALQPLIAGHLDSTRTRIALSIEDDAARLDVNDLDARAWHDLLARVGIVDWDDDDQLDSQDLRADPPGDANGDGDDDDDGLDGPFNGDNDDADNIGELAEALAELRFTLPGHRITDLDQLLLADPGHNADVVPASHGYGTTNDPPVGSWGFRLPLTHHELELLRPYLTVHGRGQGRDSGRLDLGTIIEPGVLDADVRDVVAPGSVLWTDAGESWRVGRDGNDLTDWDVRDGGSVNPSSLAADTVLQVEAPSPVNLWTATNVVKHVVLGMASPTPPDPNPGADQFLGWGDLATMAAGYGPLATTAYALVDPIASGRALPPADIRSWGIVRVRSGASATDAKDRPVATAQRTVVAQALPNGVELPAWWQRQDELELSRRRHHASRLMSWPQPVNRIQDRQPDDSDDAAVMTAEVATNPASAMYSPFPERNWSRPMQPAQRPPKNNPATDLAIPTVAEVLEVGDGAVEAPTVTPGHTVHPDGVQIDSGALAWRVGDADTPHAPTGSLAEVGGRHLSLWIKPGPGGWTTLTPILEMRAPLANCLTQIDPTEPLSNEFQNLWRLHYDPDLGGATSGGYLVLTLANPAIEHTTDASRSDGVALMAPEDVFSPTPDAPFTLSVNEQSLGATAFLAAAATADPPVDFTPLPLSPAHPHNRVQFLYKMDPPRSDRWYHLQVIVSHDRPGGQSILIDGFAGRDVGGDTGLAASDLQQGDHATFPAMLLDQALPTVDLVANDHALGMREAEIALAGSAIHEDLGLDATGIFPRRGTVLIGDEYISYTGVEADKLTGCFRSVRANSNTASGDANEWWPVTQAHAVGDLVLPGGYRFASGGQLYAGEAIAAHVVRNGDPAPGSRRWRVWTRASDDDSDYSADAATHVTSPPAPVDGEIITIGRSLGDPSVINSVLPITATDGVPAQFPTGVPGLIRVQGRSLADTDMDGDIDDLDGTIDVGTSPPTFSPVTRSFVMRFDSFDGSRFTGLRIPDELNLATPEEEERINFLSSDSSYADQVPPPSITLISLTVTGPGGASPLLAEPYFRNHTGSNRRETNQLQIVAADGRIEWISYDLAWTDPADGASPTYGFFVNTSGFARNSRGRERTVFAGDYLDYGGATTGAIDHTTAFPSGAQILPVQTAIGASHWIATGDVVTIMPRALDLGTTAGRPVQMVVRFAATDGYREVDAASVPAHPGSFDTKNEWFAFTDPVPQPWVGAEVEFLSGLCWTGRDLSAYAPRTNRRTGLMPRMDLLEPNLFVASDSPHRLAGQTVASGTVIDGLVAGALPGSPVGRSELAMVTAIGGDGVLDPGELDVVITADMPAANSVFPQNHGGTGAQETYGLARIGGEIVAYQRESPTQARIIARGLLGSTPSRHEVVATPRNTGAPFLTGPAITWLPIGPVGRFDGTMAPGFRGEAPFVSSTDRPNRYHQALSDAPAMLLVKRDAALADSERYEFALLAHDDVWDPVAARTFRKYFAAPWLRGAYGSPVQSIASGDLAIAWWPRHPSALPSAPSAEHFRCRAYAWAGFPVRFVDTFFPQSDAAYVTAAGATELDDSGNPVDLFTLEARALADGIDWASSSPVALIDGVRTDVSAAFDGARFGDPVQGAELKVTWHYRSEATTLRQMVERTGISATIDEVELRPLSGIRILGTAP